jgi:diguanylate cyclase (GGDEF)-like protein/PAS domain S-box-containing protein
MARPLIRGAVLVVVMNRDDRRVLFETLDAYAFEEIYTATTFAQAQVFLSQAARIDLVLLEFAGDGQDALAFCRLLTQPGAEPVPVIGIAPTAMLQDRWSWENEPTAVIDWLRSPLLGEEALHRIQAALRPRLTAHADDSVSGATGSFSLDNVPDEVVVWDPATGIVLEVNRAFESAMALSRTQAQGRSFESLDLTRDATAADELRKRLRRDGHALHRFERLRGDGARQWVEAHSRLSMHGGDTVCVSSLREAGAPQQVGNALQIAVDVGSALVGTAMVEVVQTLQRWLKPDGLWVVMRRPDQGQEFVIAAQETGGDERAPNWEDVFRRLRTGEPVLVVEGASRVFSGDAAFTALDFDAFAAAPMVDERLDQIGALVVGARRSWAGIDGLRDILEIAAMRIALDLELERAREQGRAKGLQDSLTSLPNRLLFNDRLETTIKEAHRTGEMFAVLFVDLDRFKNINDSLGHSVGDEVLIAVSKRLRASVRGADTVARYAGDEFTLILRHIVQREDVLRIAEKICRVLEAPLNISDSRELHITSSIGISFYPDDATTGDRLLQHADVAMYSAKGMGRNTFQTYVAVPEESHQQRLALEAKLRQAERNNELRVYYQPQVDAVTEDVVGMEALIRWEHPELGMISPGFFIPLAEETGLIVSIGEWVLRQAVHETRRWQQRFNLPLRISVNLSALQLRQPNLLDTVERALHDSGLEARYLELEVTESISVKSIPNLIENLQAIRDLGCQIAIDDFGTGQSSLDYIRRFPADRIKIDQVFVRNIGVDPDDEAIVRATIHMAHNLNRHVVAEGVEYEEHLSFLQNHGCEELQGYLFCRPLPPTSFENMMAERERLLSGAAL